MRRTAVFVVRLFLSQATKGQRKTTDQYHSAFPSRTSESANHYKRRKQDRKNSSHCDITSLFRPKRMSISAEVEFRFGRKGHEFPPKFRC